MPEKYSYGLVFHERESEAWLTIRKKTLNHFVKNIDFLDRNVKKHF
jgi:hypothetical protein